MTICYEDIVNYWNNRRIFKKFHPNGTLTFRRNCTWNWYTSLRIKTSHSDTLKFILIFVVVNTAQRVGKNLLEKTVRTVNKLHRNIENEKLPASPLFRWKRRNQRRWSAPGIRPAMSDLSAKIPQQQLHSYRIPASTAVKYWKKKLCTYKQFF